MGATNFTTKSDIFIHVGILPQFNYEDEDERELENEEISWTFDRLREAVDNINDFLVWHELVLDTGYYEGIELYVKEINAQQMVENCRVGDVTVCNKNGYEMELDQVYAYDDKDRRVNLFRKGQVGLTYHSLDRAINRDRTIAYNHVVKLAQEYGLNDAWGGWCSGVADELTYKRKPLGA